MLLLVLADRNMGGAVEQDVGRHQHRIVVETDRCILAVLARLLLELRHAVEPAHPRHAIEDPGKLRMSGDLALVEHNVLLRIDAARYERRSHLAGVARELGRTAPDVDRHGDGVHVDDAIDAIVRLLHLHEVDDRAEVIAEMQIAGRLDARKDPFNESHRPFSLSSIWRCRLPRTAYGRKAYGHKSRDGRIALTRSRKRVTL